MGKIKARKYAREEVDDIAMQAAYLLDGYNQKAYGKHSETTAVTNKLLGRPQNYIPPYQDNNGHTGVCDRLVEFAYLVHEACERLGEKYSHDFPGVFEYEVTEQMGAWFYDNSECSIEAFAAELERRAEEFFKQGETSPV